MAPYSEEILVLLALTPPPPPQLVYNLSKGESELQSVIPWLLNIQARAPSSPVIIVGTHTDKIPQGTYMYIGLAICLLSVVAIAATYMYFHNCVLSACGSTY